MITDALALVVVVIVSIKGLCHQKYLRAGRFVRQTDASLRVTAPMPPSYIVYDYTTPDVNVECMFLLSSECLGLSQMLLIVSHGLQSGLSFSARGENTVGDAASRVADVGMKGCDI